MGSAEGPSWWAVEGLLAPFGTRRAEARRRYAKFVAEGLDRPSVWNELKGQIFLGSDRFVKRLQARNLSTTLRHLSKEFSVAYARSPAG